MIVSKISGGLGNQLFQYAIGRALAQANNTDLLLDTQAFIFDSKRHYGLSAYSLPVKIAEPAQIEDIYQDIRLVRRLLHQNHWRLVREKARGYDAKVLLSKGNIYLQGYWQSYKYFDSLRKVLLSELIPQQHSKYRLPSDSVAIHIRRGDLVAEEITRAVHGVLPLTYYQTAINLLKGKIKDPHWYIFTDDLGWVQANFPNLPNSQLIKDNSPQEDIYYMSRCQHHIIGNSTFSWWGAWLADSAKQIVIAPKQWSINKNWSPRDLIPDKWIEL